MRSAPTAPVDEVATRVAATLTAWPTMTLPKPPPTPTPYPTDDLVGLFCEYEFCIGHPPHFPFFDLQVINSLTTRSEYAQGNLIGFNNQLYIFLIWSQYSGEFEPKAALNFTLGEDQPAPLILTENIGGRSVTYVKLESTPSNLLPYGLAAVWKCGGRWFGWKVYSPQENEPINLLWEAVRRFRCR